MKKIICLLVIFLSCYAIGWAQYFSKQLDMNGNSELSSQIIQVEDSYLILNGSLCGENQKKCVSIFKTNLDGELLWQREIDSLTIFSSKSILVDGDTFFLISAPPVSEGQLDENIVLQKFDMNGELQGEWFYGDEEIEEYPTAIAKLNNYILITVKHTDTLTGYRIGSILFINDETFEIERKVPFGENFSSIFARFLFVDAEKNILLPMLGLYNSFLTGRLIKYDSTGTKLWETTLSYNDHWHNLTIDVVELHNGNYAVGWHNDDDNNNWPPTIFGVSRDGDVLWEQTLPDTIARKNVDQLFLTQNGDIVGLGLDLDVGGGYDDFHGSGGWIFRMSEEGEILWERTIVDVSLIDYLPFGQFLLGGTELDNGDLVFTGSTQDTFPNADPFINNPNTWLLRLDSEGCLVPNCGSLQVIIGDSIYTDIREIPPYVFDNRVELFPNPASSIITINLEKDFDFDKNIGADIAVYNLEGQLVLYEKTSFFPKKIDVSNLAKGFYIVNIEGRFVAKFIKE